MKSIRGKLILGIVLILSIFFAGIITYSITFKNYFQKEKLNEMEGIIQEVDRVIENSNLDNIDDILLGLSEKYNVQIEVNDIGSGNTICSTHRNGKYSMMGSGMGGQNKLEVVEYLGDEDGFNRAIIHDKSVGIEFLTIKKENASFMYDIIVKTPINIMDDAVYKSLRLLMMIFIPITAVALFLTILFAKFFTKPIIEIRRKTAQIRDLNFGENLVVNGEDEISDLANCVNNLSYKIESTLNALNDKNNELEKMIQKERDNEVIRREFVSSVSHELKSPIAVISGYSQALKEGFIKSKEDVEYYISVIDEEANRMQIIVNDLLDLYKLESNTFKLNLQEVDLEELVNRIIKKNQFRLDNVNVKVEISNDKTIVVGDYVRIEQAIQNFINNAISHIDEKRIIRIRVTNNESKIRISVMNSGENIEEYNLEKIWQGFVRIDSVRNYKEKRVGLGLAIVKQIIMLHGGSYGVDNINGGVEFWIELNSIT